jgi:hypothetical protein
MQKSKKRGFLWMVLIVAMFAIMSGGCGDGGDGGDDGESLSVSPATYTLSIGNTVELTADYTGAPDTLVWLSSEPSVATVNGSGATATVTALAPGTAEITVTDGSVEDKCVVTVEGNWSDATDESWYDKDNPPENHHYHLTTASELAGLAKLVSDGETFEGFTVMLGDDIDLAGGQWAPIGSDNHNDHDNHDDDGHNHRDHYVFEGTFDGGGHTILNLAIVANSDDDDDNDQYYGLFGQSSGTIKNVTLSGVNIDVSFPRFSYAGGVAGSNTGTLTGCNVDGRVSSASSESYSYAGGIAGYNDGTLTYCNASAAVSSSSVYSYAGGIAGQNYATLTDCGASGAVSASDTATLSYAGGVIGYLYNLNDAAVSARNTFSLSGTGQEFGIGGGITWTTGSGRPTSVPIEPNNDGCRPLD